MIAQRILPAGSKLATRRAIDTVSMASNPARSFDQPTPPKLPPAEAFDVFGLSP